MKIVIALLSWMLLDATLVAAAQDASPSSIFSGVFTAQQVQHGQDVYQKNCMSCHGPQLASTEPAATQLTGRPFRVLWYRRTLAQQFSSMRTNMPPSGPGSLAAEDYVDIIAYILHFNGYPSGDRPLTPDINQLKQIVVEPLPASK